MGASISSGPIISTGNLNVGQNTEPDSGPDLSYQASGIIDVRFSSASIGAAPGRKVFALFAAPYIPLVDMVPQANATANLFAAATVAATTAASAAVSAGLGAGFISANMTILGQSTPASGNIAGNIPFLPAGQAPQASNFVIAPAALEFGFGLGGNIATCTSGSTTLVLAAAANNKYFYVGQRLIVAGAGNAGGTSPLITTVTAISGANITMADAALATKASGTQVGTADPGGLGYAYPWQIAGIDALLDSAQCVRRGLRVVSSNAGDTTFKLIVRGYDCVGFPMTEVISLNGTTVVYGKKAFKYITQMNIWNASSATTAGNITVGTSDVFGMPIRMDFWEYMNVYWNQTFQTAAPAAAGNGWVAADASTPTGTTGDVRGTLQAGANGGNATNFATSPNGSIRLAAFTSLPPYNALNASNLNYSTMFGQTNYAG